MFMSEKNSKSLQLPVYNQEDLAKQIADIAPVYNLQPIQLINYIVADWLCTFHVANDTYNPDRKDVAGSPMLSFLASHKQHSDEFKRYLDKCQEKRKD